MPRRRRLSLPRSPRPSLVGVVGLLAMGVFDAIRLATHSFAPGAFAVAGDVFVHPGAPRELIVTRGSAGYDGQFYYRLALDPLTHRVTAFGITLDNPAYRAQRVGLPLAVHLAHAATGLSVAWLFIIINTLAAAAACAVGAVLARRMGRVTWWGLALGLAPAVIIGTARDLTEPLASFGLLAGIALWLAGRRWSAAVLLTVAALSRETVLVVAAGMAIGLLIEELRGGGRTLSRTASGLAALALPAVADVGWQWHLSKVWGTWPVAAAGNVGTPFVRMAVHFFDGAGNWTSMSHPVVLAHLWLLERVVLALVLVAAAIAAVRSPLPLEVRCGFALATVLAVSIGWSSDVSFFRSANEALLLATIVLLSRRADEYRWALRAVPVMSALVALTYAVGL